MKKTKRKSPNPKLGGMKIILEKQIPKDKRSGNKHK
jgi:hypothetical protein